MFTALRHEQHGIKFEANISKCIFLIEYSKFRLNFHLTCSPVLKKTAHQQHSKYFVSVTCSPVLKKPAHQQHSKYFVSGLNYHRMPISS